MLCSGRSDSPSSDIMESSMASSMAEDLKCSICLTFFQEPQMLYCGHNFCLSCLEHIVLRDQNSGKCPECRLPFSQEEFLGNRALANLAERARQLLVNQEPPQGVSLDEICKDHNEPLVLFCKQDLVPACVGCLKQPVHRQHNFLTTKIAAEYAKGRLKEYQSQLRKSLKKVKKHVVDQEQKITTMKTCTDKILNHISKECEDLHQVLNKQEEDFKKNVEEMQSKNMGEMQDTLRSLREEMSSHTEMNTNIKNALEIADSVAFLKDFKDLMSRVKTFQAWKNDNGDYEPEKVEKEEVEDVGSYGDTVTPSLKAGNGNLANNKNWKENQSLITARPFQLSPMVQPIILLRMVLYSFALCCLFITFIHFWFE